MAASQRKQDLFDFSLDALDFKEKLRRQLMEKISASAFEPVEDNDLIWVNAAGNPHMTPDGKKRCDSKASKPLE